MDQVTAAASVTISMAVVQIVLFLMQRSLMVTAYQASYRQNIRSLNYLAGAVFFLVTFWRLSSESGLAIIMHNVIGLITLVVMMLAVRSMSASKFDRYTVLIVLGGLVLMVLIVVTGIDQVNRVHIAGIVCACVFFEIFRIFVAARVGASFAVNYCVIGVAGLTIIALAIRSMMLVAEPAGIDQTWPLYYASVPATIMVVSLALFVDESVRMRDSFSLLSNRNKVTGLTNWFGAKKTFLAVQNMLRRENRLYGIIVVTCEFPPEQLQQISKSHDKSIQDGLALGIAATLRLVFRASDIVCEFDRNTWMAILPESRRDLVELVGKRLMVQLQNQDITLGDRAVIPSWHSVGAVFEAEASLDGSFAACRFAVDRMKKDKQTGFKVI